MDSTLRGRSECRFFTGCRMKCAEISFLTTFFDLTDNLFQFPLGREHSPVSSADGFENPAQGAGLQLFPQPLGGRPLVVSRPGSSNSSGFSASTAASFWREAACTPSARVAVNPRTSSRNCSAKPAASKAATSSAVSASARKA